MTDDLLMRIMLDPDASADPYPLMRELRETSPVHKLADFDNWFVTRFEDCRAALRDQRMGHYEAGDEISPALLAPPLGMTDGPHSVLELNPPAHTRVRGLMSRAFTPRRVEQLRPFVDRLTNERLDAIAADGGECNLVDALTYPLACDVISELVGVPVADRAWTRPHVSNAIALLDPTASPEVQQRGWDSLALLKGPSVSCSSSVASSLRTICCRA